MLNKQLIKGLLTYIPGHQWILPKKTGGSESARYCYSVWMRHLVLAFQNGMTEVPHAVAELGPGDSLGIGLCALLSGADQYDALDVVDFASHDKNMNLYRELVKLFLARAPIPGPDEFPEVKPFLSSYEFPKEILSETQLAKSLQADRLAQIEAALKGQASGIRIVYRAPWSDEKMIRHGSIDFIFSQAVLEHVDDLEGTYRAFTQWLKPGGMMSHQIDFKSHGTSRKWFGHWTYRDWQWKLILGKRPYLLNRKPLSVHLDLLKQNGFQILFQGSIQSPKPCPRQSLAPGFEYFTDEDLYTSGLFFLASNDRASST